jgi:hypothetical protein
MTLQIKNDHERGTGFVALNFDQSVNLPLLKISVLDKFKRLFLGRSVPGKPNWITTRTEFFDAARVSGDERSTTYSIGPNITTFIPEGAVVEISSSDGSLREDVVWEGVNVLETWDGAGAWVAVQHAVGSPFEWSWNSTAIGALQNERVLAANVDRAAADKAISDRTIVERATAERLAAEDRAAVDEAVSDRAIYGKST